MQLDYDYFTSSDCKILKSRVQTNPRYKNFNQMYYTVGDTEQFWVATHLSSQKKDETRFEEPQISKDNVFKNMETFVPFEGYMNISPAQVEDTFNYIFNKFKKGIFIRIKNGQLESFIPFSKAYYINEWSNLIKTDPKYGSFENFFKVHHDLANKLNGTSYRFNVNRINLDPSFWFANNCILRYEKPTNEGENNYAQLKSMFLELCAERQVPDIEFFVNRRDFPILTRNLTEPYFDIYGDDVPLKSYKFDKYAPILSMCSSDKFADVAIPTHEDWARIKSNEGIYFPQKCRNYSFKFNHKWETKKSMAVFRGANTGCGFNEHNNTRLKLASLGALHPQLLNVGLTNWNLRIRKVKGYEYLQIPDVGNLSLVAKLSPEEQSNYKYLINVDGHVSAFRLSLELSMGCCILMVESTEKWKMWFSDLLEPYVHYVPIKANLMDLIDQLKWCLKNDDKCKVMAQNALKFYSKFLTKKGVLDNLQRTLFKLKDDTRFCGATQPQTQDPLLFQSNMEYETLMNDNKVDKYKVTGLFPRNVGRNYGALKGLEQFVTLSLKPENQITVVGMEVQTIFKSKTTKVVLHQIGAEYVVVKKTIDPMKKVEFIHEAFIGKHVVNNLLKSCPNFVFTLQYRDEPYVSYQKSEYIFIDSDKYYGSKEAVVLQEFIKGPTLQAFLKTCSIKACLEVLFSLSCALIIAQTNYGFVHRDLKPWNVMVEILPEPITIEYYLRPEGENGPEVVFKIKTRYIPIIIDYGKSHVIFNNIHYGLVEPYTVDKYIDFVTMLLSTINELVLRLDPYHHPAGVHTKENIGQMDLNDLIFIANFLSVEKVKNIQELKTFLYKTKKFGNLNMADVSINPKSSQNIFEEFFKYVSPLKNKYKIGFGKDKLTLNTWSSNSRQITDMGFGLELDDKVNSYLEVVRRIYKNPMPQATNRFSTIMIAQKLFDGVLVPKLEFVEFATQQNLTKRKVDEVLKEFNKMEKFVMDFYTTQLNKKVREPFKLEVDQKIKTVLAFDVRPSRSLFLSSIENKVKLTQKMKDLPAQFPDYLYYRSLVLDVLRNKGPFQLQEDDKKFYMDNFKLLFDETFTLKVVDIETIRFFLNL